MRLLNFSRGSTIIVKDSVNKGFFYIVKSGLLTVDRGQKMVEKELSRFGPGDSFGLVSALTGQKYLTTIFAATDSQVYEIPVASLGKFLKEKKDLALRMLGLYTRELRTIHKYLARVNPPQMRNISTEKLLQDARSYIDLKKERFAFYALEKYIEASRAGLIDGNIAAAEKLLQGLEKYTSPVWTGNSMGLGADEILFLENEPSSEIYVVKSGAVKLFSLARNQELVLDILGPGEIFGEMAFIDHRNRLASAVTETESLVMRFSKDTLLDSVGEIILQKIFESLARRIWFSHQRLMILRIADPLARIYAFLSSMIRDKEIRDKIHDAQVSFEFNIDLDELKKMCGLGKVNHDRIEIFLKDSNIEIGKHVILVKNRKYVDDKIAYYMTREVNTSR